MSDPLGQNTYKGLAVPLYGESVIEQQNSSNTIMTLMHSTANTGRLMMGMDYANIDGDLRTSALTDLAVWDIDADGGFRVVSGTTVIMELNSSGLYAGSKRVISPHLGFGHTGQIVTTAGSATAVSVTSAASGTLFFLSTGLSSFVRFTLTATPEVGDYYDFFSDSTAAAGSIRIQTAAAGDAQGFVFYQSTADFLSTASITGVTSGPFYVRVTALTSGSLWAVQALYQYDNSSGIYGNVAAGTTSS